MRRHYRRWRLRRLRRLLAGYSVTIETIPGRRTTAKTLLHLDLEALFLAVDYTGTEVDGAMELRETFHGPLSIRWRHARP